MLEVVKTTIVGALAILLASCGGGGSDGIATTGTLGSPVTYYPLKIALANIVNDDSTKLISISGKSMGMAVSGTGVLTQSPPIEASFEGVTGIN